MNQSLKWSIVFNVHECTYIGGFDIVRCTAIMSLSVEDWNVFKSSLWSQRYHTGLFWFYVNEFVCWSLICIWNLYCKVNDMIQGYFCHMFVYEFISWRLICIWNLYCKVKDMIQGYFCLMFMSSSVEDWYVFEIYIVKSKIWYRTNLALCMCVLFLTYILLMLIRNVQRTFTRMI